MTDKSIVFKCCTPGIAGTTDVHVKKLDDGTFEARIGFALFGSTNMDEEGFKRAEYNPFHPEFNDNYSVGKGATKEEAIEDLKKDQAHLYESIWF